MSKKASKQTASSYSLRVSLVLLSVAALAFRFLFFRASTENLPALAKETLNFLQAKEIAGGTRPLFFSTTPFDFPFEAYLASFLNPILSWDTLGLRLTPLLLSLCSILLLFLLCRKLAPSKESWIIFALLLFPSSSLLQHQAGFFLPQLSAAMLLSALLLLCLAMSKESSNKTGLLWCFLTGLVAGISLSNQFFSLAVVLPCALVACFGSNLENSKKNIWSFTPGLLLGLTPLLYAKFFISGAYPVQASLLPLTEGLSRLSNPVLRLWTPTALGIDPYYFAGEGLLASGEKLSSLNWLVVPAAYCFSAIVLFSLAAAAFSVLKSSYNNGWPQLGVKHAITGSCFLSLFFMALLPEERVAESAKHAVIFSLLFPLLLLISYRQLSETIRSRFAYIALAPALLLLALNIFNSYKTLNAWQQSDFAEQRAGVQSIAPLLSSLKKLNIDNCYAPWNIAYPLIFESEGKILCSPPFNDRYPGWQQPAYRQVVDQKAQTAYVTTAGTHPLLDPETFKSYISLHETTFEQITIGAFQLYNDFSHKEERQLHLVPAEKVKISTSSSQRTNKLLSDGKLQEVWTTDDYQKENMYIQLELAEVHKVAGIRYLSPVTDFKRDLPRLRIEVRDSSGVWKQIMKDRKGHPHLLKLDSEAPRYHHRGLELSVGFPSVLTDAIRLVVHTEAPSRAWQVSEVQLLEIR